MIEKVSNAILKKIIKKEEVNTQKKEVLLFGITRIIEDSIKLIVILIIAAMLDLFYLTAFTIFVGGAIKYSFGGAHMKTNLGCFIISAVCAFGIIVLSKLMLVAPLILTIIIYVSIFILSIGIVIKYCPADTEEIPILSKRIRRRLRIIAFLTIGIIFISLFMPINNIIKNIIMFNLLLTTFTVTPVFYKLVNSKYSSEVDEICFEEN